METWMVMRKSEMRMKEMLLMVTKMRKQMAVLTSYVFYLFFMYLFSFVGYALDICAH